MKRKLSVDCWSDETGKRLLSLSQTAAAGAAEINCCHPVQRKECSKEKRCERFWPDGTYFFDRALARLLKKNVSRLSDKDRYKRSYKFTEKAFRKCKPIKVTVTYQSINVK